MLPPHSSSSSYFFHRFHPFAISKTAEESTQDDDDDDDDDVDLEYRRLWGRGRRRKTCRAVVVTCPSTTPATWGRPISSGLNVNDAERANRQGLRSVKKEKEGERRRLDFLFFFFFLLFAHCLLSAFPFPLSRRWDAQRLTRTPCDAFQSSNHPFSGDNLQIIRQNTTQHFLVRRFLPFVTAMCKRIDFVWRLLFFSVYSDKNHCWMFLFGDGISLKLIFKIMTV